MDHLRSSVNLRAYGQRDPLVEYKKEGLQLFKTLEEVYVSQVVRLLPQMEEGGFARRESQELQETHAGAKSIVAQGGTHVRSDKKIGRNDQVTITNGAETKTMKYKKAEPLLASGKWKLSA